MFWKESMAPAFSSAVSTVYLVKGDLRGSCEEQCPKLSDSFRGPASLWDVSQELCLGNLVLFSSSSPRQSQEVATVLTVTLD